MGDVSTQATQSYDPRRSNVKEEALAEFIRAPITGDLTEVRRRMMMMTTPLLVARE